jgi:hypothetical protein
MLVIVWAFFGPYFRLRRVDCQNQANQPCDPNVVAELKSHLGRSIFTIPGKDITAKIEAANPAYQQVIITAKLPDLLTVRMVDREEYALLKSASTSAALVINQNLLVVAKSIAPPTGTFLVISDRALQVGVGDYLSDQALVAAFSLGRLLTKAYIPTQYFNLVTPDYLLVLLADGKQAVFSTTLDLSRQVTSLQLILQKATIQKEPRVIDLRFDKPVLKY